MAIRLTARSVLSDPSRYDLAGGKAKTPLPRHRHCDQVAVNRSGRRVRRYRQFASELFLVDRHQSAAAIG